MVCREILEILKVYDAGKYFWNPAKLENIRIPFGIVFGVPASPSKKRMENEGLWRSSTVHFSSFGANVGHVGNIFAYRCFLFAVPMLRVCRAAPLKSRFRSQDIITALPVTSWEPPNPRKVSSWAILSPCKIPREI